MPSLIELTQGRYPIGMFYLDKELWTDEGVRQAAGTGADFFVSVDSSPELLSLFERYGLGMIATSNFPLWWGGDGENAGGYARKLPLERMDEVQKTYPKSPALWGDYPVDEPNARDFAHIDSVVKRYRELFADKLPFVNLYPNYASVPQNSGEEVVSQLGNRTYAEHIAQYVRDIDLPYICFDYYPFTGVFSTYLENLDVVSRACKASGREMWVIIQTGAWKPEAILSGFQIDWQAYLCLAYGARAILHASYSKGWWDEATSCVNLRGEKNPTCEYARSINAALHALGPAFLQYEWVHTGVLGDIASSDERIRPQLEKQNAGARPADLPDIRISSDKAVVVGYFRKPGGHAVMIVNAHNPFDASVSARVAIETVGGRTSVYQTAGAMCADSSCSVDLTIASGQGVFVTVEEQ